MFLFKKEPQTDAQMPPDTAGRLNLPVAIASELSRLATLELKSQTDPQLDGVYQDFLTHILRHTALGLLHGMVIFKPYIRGKQLYIHVATPQNFKILAWDETHRIPLVTEFYEFREGFVRIERHSLEKDVYTVTNFAMQDGKIMEYMPSFWSGYAPVTHISGCTKPLFSVFSTWDGRPVYEKAKPLIREAEQQFNRLIWEFESGERALYVADTAFLKDRTGKRKVPDKRLYRLLSTSQDDLFQDWTPTLRQSAIIEGLNCILERIEDSCALARGTFSDTNLSVRTATELKMARHRTYATVKGVQTALAAALRQLLIACANMLCLYGARKNAGAEAVFQFDDSVLRDKSSELSDMLSLLDKGVLTKEEVRTWWCG